MINNLYQKRLKGRPKPLKHLLKQYGSLRVNRTSQGEVTMNFYNLSKGGVLMGAPRKDKTEDTGLKLVKQRKPREEREHRPASTPESREQQLVSLAVDLAEKQLRDGTASAAVMTHYLKIGTSREILERDILENQAAFIKAKAASISKDKDSDALAKAAIDALKSYNSGS